LEETEQGRDISESIYEERNWLPKRALWELKKEASFSFFVRIYDARQFQVPFFSEVTLEPSKKYKKKSLKKRGKGIFLF